MIRLSSFSRVATPLLRVLEPERAHDAALWALRNGLAGRWRYDSADLQVRCLGTVFSNPLGLAAGFDKNGLAVAALMQLGFGFVEIGTVTPLAQAGNPRPRLFRLERDRAIINRMGFNNHGAAALEDRLRAMPALTAPLGVNIGINKEGADPERDYADLVRRLGRFASYIAVNVSSPNTPGLRDLQGEKRLAAILQAILAGCPVRPPILVKLAPDLSDAAIEAIVGVALDASIDGLIISNTTIGRPGHLISPNAKQAGGLSGAPLFARSTEMLGRAYRLAGRRLTIIGVGGVSSGADVLAKLTHGASLVQLYSAFVYEGPSLVPRILGELQHALKAQGFSSPQQAIGAAIP